MSDKLPIRETLILQQEELHFLYGPPEVKEEHRVEEGTMEEDKG